MNWYLKALGDYAVFTGRSRRKEYWFFFLINFIIAVALTLVDMSIGKMSESGYGLFTSIFRLAVLVPSIAVGIRRMHDVGKSGWYLLIPIYNLILTFTDGEKGENQYGSDPKEIV